MIKILHSELQSNIGGIEAFLLNLTRSMDMTNIHFDMVMRGNNSYLENELSKLGVTIYKVPSNPFQYSRFIKKLLKQNNYDFVHVHKNSAANILLPVLVKKYSNAKLIVHSHNTSPSGGTKAAIILHILNKDRLYRLSDYCFACSDTAAEWMFGNNYQEKNIKIIKNGIITQDYVYNPALRDEMRHQLGLEDKFVVGHVGAFREQKNHKFLLDMFAQLAIPNAELVLVGDGPLKGKIKTQAQKLGIVNRVKFLGSRNDVNKLLQAFDLFVMPSLWEGLGIAAIEAQTSGLNTIVSDNFPAEIKITNQVRILPLKKSVWVNEIETMSKNKPEHFNVISEIQSAGYDMVKSAKKVRKIYESKN